MSGPPGSFYVTGGSLAPSAPSYVARKADDELYSALADGQLCYVLDTRQVGKSSLMVRAAARLRAEGVRVAAMDLSGAGRNVEPEQWYMGLLHMASSQLDAEEACEAFWRRHSSLSPVVRFMATIQEVLLAASEAPLVLFIDEIDAVRGLPFTADELFAAVRAAFNLRADRPELRRLTFCLIGVATPSDLIRDARTTPFNVGRRIELTDFTREEAAGLAAGLNAKTNGARLIGRILHWTGGHPYLTQRLCRALAETGCDGSDGQVDRVCRATFLTRQAREVDDNLAFARDRIMSPYPGAGLAATLLLYRSLLDGRRRVPNDPTDPRVALLRLAGVVKPDDGHIAVRCRIYARAFDRRWVDGALPGEEVRRMRRALRVGYLRASAVWATGMALLAVAVGQAFRAGGLERRVGALRSQEARLRRSMAEMQHRTTAMERRQLEMQEDTARTLRKNRAAVAVEQARARQAEAQRIRAAAAAEAMQGAVASGLAVVSGREVEALRTGLQAVEPAVNEGREPPEEALQGLADAVNQGLVRRWRRLMDRPFTGVALSTDGRRLAVCWDSGTVLMLDPATGRTLRAIRAGGRVRAMDCTDDGRRLITYGLEGRLCLWDLEARGGPVRLRTWEMGPHSDPRARVCMGQTRIACSRAGGRCTVVEMDGAGQVNMEKAHTGAITDIATSEERPVVATSGTDGAVYVFEDTTGKFVSGHTQHSLAPTSLKRNSEETVRLVFTHDRLVSGDSRGSVFTWVWARSELLYENHPTAAALNCLTTVGSPYFVGLSSKTRRVAICISAHMVDPLAATAAATDGTVRVAGGEHQGGFAAVDGDGTVEMWRYAARHRGSVVEQVSYGEVAADNRTVYYGGKAPVVYRWDAIGGDLPFMMEMAPAGSLRAVGHVACSPAGHAVAVALGTDIVLYPDGKAETSSRWRAGEKYLWAIEWTPDGSAFYTACADGRVALWDAKTQRQMAAWQLPGSPRSIRVSRDGATLAAACADGAAYVWSASGVAGFRAFLPPGREVERAKTPATHYPWQAAWSPDGKLLVTADDDGNAYLYRSTDGKVVATLPTFGGRLLSAYFSPDGKSLLTAGTDTSVRLWDVATALAAARARRRAQPRLIVRAHREGINSATFSPDGQWILTTSRDTTARLLPATAKAYVRAAREMLALVAPSAAAPR